LSADSAARADHDRYRPFLPTVKIASPRLLVLLPIYAAFVSLGLPDGILGAAWPQMRAHFAVDLNDNWPMLALGTCGGALSSFLSGIALRRLGVGKVLVVTTFLTAFVILGYSFGKTFAVITGLAFFLGLGNGAIDAGLNNFVARNLSSRHMNWLHAFWGVGSSLGTVVVSGALATGGTFRTAYLGVGLLQLCLAFAFVLNLRALPDSSQSPEEQRVEHPAFGVTLALPASWASMATFFAYCGLESGTGLWIASLLHDGRGWTMEAASLMVTLYWGSLTAGRFLIGTVSQRTTPIRIVRTAAVGVLAGTILIALTSVLGGRTAAGLVAALGLLVLGLGLSPIFPMLMHDTPRCVGQGHAVNLIGFQGSSAQLGFTLLPIAMGTLMQRYSTEWLGFMLTLLALVVLALLAVRERFALGHVRSVTSE
jgi:fucose permease